MPLALNWAEVMINYVFNEQYRLVIKFMLNELSKLSFSCAPGKLKSELEGQSDHVCSANGVSL